MEPFWDKTVIQGSVFTFYVGNILTGKIVGKKFEGKNFKIKTQYFLRFIE